jgi:GntR family histidine utilization transcriptional repressor
MAKAAGKRAAPRDLPRYAQIRRALESEILSGAWPPGHRVPSEHQLLRRYRCSRMTVNKALSALAASGMIVRRRRWGSFVSEPSGRNVLQIQDIEQDVLKAGGNYRVALLHRAERKATKVDEARLQIETGDAVLDVQCLHYIDGQPWLLEDRLINLAAVPSARRADFSKRSPGSWLLQETPWSHAEHDIRAANASRETAKALKIATGFACLIVERRTSHAGKTITHVVLQYPGDRHKLTASFNPSGAADR